MNDYKIKLRDIKNDCYSLNYAINDTFFNDFKYSEVKHANILATIKTEKKNNQVILSIDLLGKINHLLCDICAEDISIDIASTTKIVVKKTLEKIESTDEIIYIHPNDNELSIKHLLFELINLSVPNKIRHKLKEGISQCNEEMISLINKYANIKKKSQEVKWEALNKLKI